MFKNVKRFISSTDMATAFMLTISNRQIFLISKINKTLGTLDLFFLVSFDGFFNLQQKKQLIH